MLKIADPTISVRLETVEQLIELAIESFAERDHLIKVVRAEVEAECKAGNYAGALEYLEREQVAWEARVRERKLKRYAVVVAKFGTALAPVVVDQVIKRLF